MYIRQMQNWHTAMEEKWIHDTRCVLLWLSSHKALTLWRLIMPITRTEKQTVPSLRWHQDEEFVTWWLVRTVADWRLPFVQRKLENTSKADCLCVCSVCVWSCATPGLRPRQMLANTAPHVHPSLPRLDFKSVPSTVAPFYIILHVFICDLGYQIHFNLCQLFKRIWFTF